MSGGKILKRSKKHKNHSRFPWRPKNSLELHINAESFYPAMINHILAAEKTVMLEMYLVESGEVATMFINAFLSIAEQGKKVYLLLDDFGCYGLNKADRERLQHENIHITYYNPLHYGKFRRNLFRTHRKILIIDHRVVFVGGAGLTDEFVTTDEDNPGWRDTMVKVEGECVPDWAVLINEAWSLYSDVPLPVYDGPIQVRDDMTHTCRVVCAVGGGRLGIKQSLIKRIRSAEHRIWIATGYFLPSLKVRRELVKAAKRGVDVRLLLPGDKSDHPAVRHAGRRFYYRLLRAGVRILEYQPRFLHEKVLLSDQWSSIGSSNIDRWNFRWNLEANQEVEDSRFAQEVAKMFEEDFKHCEEFDLRYWLHRPWYSRVHEWFWGHVDRFVDRFIH